ncbi:hypothetical protein MED193_11354 [Roseobacter sp. MED193]|nr:hypothetical protein MED193_11354 [Roseobacter sp. MED193]
MSPIIAIPFLAMHITRHPDALRRESVAPLSPPIGATCGGAKPPLAA